MADEALPLRNTRNSSVRFEFDSMELLEYDMTYGERIVGVYHSHPGGPPYPSGIDTGNMENLQESPWVWLIASFTGRRGAAGDAAEADGLSIAAFRHDPQSGLQTIPIFLAAPLQPAAVLENFRRLAVEGAKGLYGYYEAVDYTRSRLPEGKRSLVVGTRYEFFSTTPYVSYTVTF